MLNIISIQALREEPRGPAKLAKNLMKGLENINEPYVLNGNPYIYKNIYIIDDGQFIVNFKNVPKDAEILVGPVISLKRNEIEKCIGNYTFVYASNWIKKLGEKYKWHKKSVCRPVGIDTYTFTDDFNKNKDRVLIYTKRRTNNEFNYICEILNKFNIKYVHINYDRGYKENDFIKQLQHTKYAIWLSGSETQGIALEEVLSMNIPIIVWDIKKVVNNEKPEDYSHLYSEKEINEFATSAEYFDETCGIKFYDKTDVKNAIMHMEKYYNTYKPREYILNNLSLEKQAKELVSYYTDLNRGNDIVPPKFSLKNILIKIAFKIMDSKFGKKMIPFFSKMYGIYVKIFKKNF